MRLARWVPVLRVAVAVLVLAAVLTTLLRNWASVSQDLGRISSQSTALALFWALSGLVLTMLSWRVLLADIGSQLAAAPAASVFFVGQLGKYLPGSVWTVVVQTEMGATLRVPRRQTALAGLISIGLGVLTGLLVGLPALFFERGHLSLWWLVVAVPLLPLACVPRLLNAAIAFCLRLLRRPPVERPLSGRALLASTALCVGAWLCFGIHLLTIAHSISGASLSSLALPAGSGYALAAAVGMFAFIAPAGFGIREGLLVLLLSMSMTTPAATAVVVISRLVVTIADLLVAALAWSYARSHHLLRRRRLSVS